MKKKMSGRDNTREIVPPKPKAKFPEGKKRPETDKSKEIVPPRAKDKPYGGKKDEETKEQITERKFPARTPATFSNKSLKELRKYKKEYRA
jgi:hypothetical protein